MVKRVSKNNNSLIVKIIYVQHINLLFSQTNFYNQQILDHSICIITKTQYLIKNYEKQEIDTYSKLKF